jgi:hypothetical protein
MADCLYYITIDGKREPLTEEQLIKHLSIPDKSGISPFDQFVTDEIIDLSQIKEKYAIQVRRPKKEVSRLAGAREDITEGGERVRPSKQRTSTAKETEGNEEVIEIRSLYKQLINRAEGLTEEQKSILINDPNALYTTLPVAKSKELAYNLIKGIGVETAVLEATKMNNGLEPVERTMILGAAMNYYAGLANESALSGNTKASENASINEIDANEKFQQVAASLGQLGTAYGRAINIFKEIYKLSNLSLVKSLQTRIDELNAVRAKQATSQAKGIGNIIKDDKSAVKQAASEITDSQLEEEADANLKASELQKEVERLKKEILERDKAQKGTKANPLKIKRVTNDTEYDKRLKDFMQRTRSIASKDDYVDLSYFGLYHIENGITKFADWYNVMSSKFKGFAKDFKSIYSSVREKAIENGAEKSLFSTDEDIVAAFEELQKDSDAKKMVTASKKAAKANLKKEEENNPDKARALAPRLAAERIRKDAESNLDMPSTEDEQTYLKKLVKTINQKAKEYYAEKKENIKNVNDILAFAIANNKKDYAIWEKTQAELEDLIDNDENLTDEKREEIKEFLADYIDSIFDTLLTKNQVSDIIRQKLIDAGFYKEKVIDNKSVKSVDWSKIVGNAANLNEAKEKITKSILDLGFTIEQAKPEINAVLEQLDSKVADIKTKEINKFLNKGVINKVKSALGEKTPKTKITKLIELNNKGMLSDANIKDALAAELGLISLSKDDVVRMRELAAIIDNPDIPYFRKRLFEEQLQYIMDTKGGNIIFLENREAVMANKLSSVYNQVQNSTGSTRAVSTLLTVILKTKNIGLAARVFGKEFINSISEAKTILIKGAVSRGSSFSDLTKVTEGEARVRYLEQGQGKFLSGKLIGKPIYAQLGGKKVDLNVLNAAYSKIKYIQRLLESVDTPSSGTISGITQFWQITKQINKFYPELSSKEKATKIYEMMYSLDREVEFDKAVAGLKASGISNPTTYEINRAINERVERARNEEMAKEFYKAIASLKPMAETKLKLEGNENPTDEEIQNESYTMIGRTSPLDVVARGERQAGRETGKVSTFGIMSIILLPVDAIQKTVNFGMKKSTSKIETTVANAGDAAMIQVFPFVHSIGRWIEMQLELTPYGALKGLAYKGFAEFVPENEKRKISNEEISELGDDYLIRGLLLGPAYTTVIMYTMSFVKYLIDDKDDDDEMVVGTAKAEKFAQERVQSVGKPKESFKLGGKYIPLDLLGNEGRVLGMWADYLNITEKSKEDDIKSKIIIGTLVVMNSAIDASWTNSASRYGSMLSNIFKGKEEKFAPQLGKMTGGILGSQIPFNRTQTELSTLLNPTTRQSIDFGTNVLNQLSMTRAFSKEKPSFDYRGRTYEYGEIYVNSADGVAKMFTKGKYGDDIDAFLSEINFAATDAYQNPSEIKDYAFGIYSPEGKKRAMTNEEYYIFRKKTADKFNAFITQDYKSLKAEEINVVPEYTLEFKRSTAADLLQAAKLEAIAEVQAATGFTTEGILEEYKKVKQDLAAEIREKKKYYKK